MKIISHEETYNKRQPQGHNNSAITFPCYLTIVLLEKVNKEMRLNVSRNVYWKA